MSTILPPAQLVGMSKGSLVLCFAGCTRPSATTVILSGAPRIGRSVAVALDSCTIRVEAPESVQADGLTATASFAKRRTEVS